MTIDIGLSQLPIFLSVYHYPGELLQGLVLAEARPPLDEDLLQLLPPPLHLLLLPYDLGDGVVVVVDQLVAVRVNSRDLLLLWVIFN